jgi:hypothetical protein
MDFEKRINNAIREMIGLGYKPTILMSMIVQDGTVNAVKKLINSKKVSDGFTKLWELQRLDLSMENIIQEPEWATLFTDDDRKMAKERLRDYNFLYKKN